VLKRRRRSFLAGDLEMRGRVQPVALVAVSLYKLSLSLHIIAVVVGFGSTFALALAFPVAMQLDARHLPYAHSLGLAINRYLAAPALVIVLATGIYQVADGDWGFGKFWVSASLLIVIVLGGLIGAYFIPADRRLHEMVSSEIAAAGDGEVTLSDDYQRRARTEGMVGGLAGLLIVVVIVLMVIKPGA
jgi:uncharacterized membrane protein